MPSTSRLDKFFTQPLTEKQHAFALNYVSNGFNAYKAAQFAGYSDNMATQTHQIIESKPLQQRLSKAMARIENKTLTQLHLLLEDRLRVLSKIIYDVVPLDGSPPRRRYYKQAISAIAEVNKICGDHAPDKRLAITVDATKERLDEIKKQYEDF